MESTGSLLISQNKTHYRCYWVFIESIHRVYMESTGSLLISQSKTHSRCYRVFIESTWSLLLSQRLDAGGFGVVKI